MTKFTKEGTIWGTFIGGWAATFIGLLTPPIGVIDNSILVVLGQSLLYCGGAIGLKTYITNTFEKLTNSKLTTKSK